MFFGLKDNPHIPSASVGESFDFEVAPGNKGKSKAVNAQQSWVGQQVLGQVMSLRDGGWGFCTVDGLEGNVLLGKKNLQSSGIDCASLTVGEVLRFEMAMASKGYEAINIQREA